MRKPNSPRPKKKYRVIQQGDRFYAQFKWLGLLWLYFEGQVPQNTFDVYVGRLDFDSREAAVQYIREAAIGKIRDKLQNKVVCYLDDTGYEF